MENPDEGAPQITENVRLRLQQAKSDGTKEITAIRIEGDDRENNRRYREESRRLERLEKKNQEQEASRKANGAVAMRMDALRKRETDSPEEVQKELKLQEKICQDIISSKDRLIKEFRDQLAAKNTEYTQSLRRQRADIDNLLQRMRDSFAILRKAYQDELTSMEDSFMKDRSDLLEANEREIQELFAQRSALEARQLAERKKKYEEFMDELDRLRAKGAQEFNDLNTELESEIQELQQQHIEMLATIKLNEEKLAYNNNVLKYRAAENKTTKEIQSTKAARLQDALTQFRAKFEQSNKEFDAINDQLTAEYKRVTEQFKELQNKFRHFELSDGRRFNEIYRMNEQAIMELMRKVLQADKIIHEQQLGVAWAPPSELTEDTQEPSPATESAVGGEKAPEEGAEDLLAQPAPVQSLLQSHRAPDHVREVLEMIASEAGYLATGLDVPEGATAEQQMMLKVDAILKVLAVRTPADLQRLLSNFFNDQAAFEDPDADIELIPRCDVQKAIAAFSADSQKIAADADGKDTPTKAKPGSAAPVKRKAVYWAKARAVVPEATMRVWHILEHEMTQYNKLLNDRAVLIERSNALRQQNDELKALLNQYLSAKVNEDLLIPPAHVIGLSQNAAVAGAAPMRQPIR